MKAPKTTLNHHLSAHYHLDEEELKPEEKSFRLWGRHNPAHYVIPYETHSQRFYKDHGDQGALDKTHYLR